MSKTFKILSLDGGGIKGLYTAIILNIFETNHGRIVDHFDMICGTSTGGLIALCLAANIPTNDIVSFYRKYGPKIFPSDNVLIRAFNLIKQIIICTKYNNAQLKAALVEKLGELVLDDAEICLCIPAVNLSTCKGIVFKTSHASILTRDKSVKMLDVALATSAAPTFFPIVDVPGISNRCIDGGLWANNPAFVGVMEALSYFVGDDKSYDDISLLSIGGLSTQAGWPAWKFRRASMAMWNKSLITLTLDCQSRATELIMDIAQAKQVLSFKNYVRINDPQLTKAQMKLITLDRSDKKALAEIEDIALAQGNMWKNKSEVVGFFQTKTKKWKFPICE